jgi:hypothetical protein
MEKVILSLCDYTGNWPAFYQAEDGYRVIRLDIKTGDDVRLVEYINLPVHGILAAPPCTAFALSGTQHWSRMDTDGVTREGLALVDACLRAVAIYKPFWWALENPKGRLIRWLGPARFRFHPYEFGGWGNESDAYTKESLLWGTFNAPEKRLIVPEYVERKRRDGTGVTRGSKYWAGLGGKSEHTKELRSTTPLGFARAFREANP